MTLGAHIIRDAHDLKWVDRGPQTDDFLTWCGHEEGLAGILSSYLTGNGTFIDVGAHAGLWSIRLAAKTGSRVMSFEPNRLTMEALNANVQINSLDRQVTTYRVALWDRECLVSLRDWNGKASGGSTAATAVSYDSADADTAPGMPLDSLIEQRLKLLNEYPPELIKVDTEGAEARVLHGATNTLMSFRPTVVLEMHGGIQNVPMTVDAECYRILDAVGYEYSDPFVVGGGRHIIATPYYEGKTPDPEGVR